MPARNNQPLSSHSLVVELGTADDPAGTYSTGQLGFVIDFPLNTDWNNQGSTALSDTHTNSTKVIPGYSFTMVWRKSSAAAALAQILVAQDGTKSFPLRRSPEGTASGATFQAGLVQFTAQSEGATAEGLQTLNLTGMFVDNSYTTGTHA